MYNSASQPPPSGEDYFTSMSNGKTIDYIVPTFELMIHFRCDGVRHQKICYVHAEKMEFKSLIQLRLSEKCDQRRMYITTVDSGSFNDLKHEQSLHVTFSGFIENLLNILQDCQSGKLEVHLVQMQANPIGGRLEASSHANDYQLQFVEMRSFKNLVHLSLPCKMAPLNVVIFYLNNILDGLQKSLSNNEEFAQQMQLKLNKHQRRIEQLEEEKMKILNESAESARHMAQRHMDEIQQMEENQRKMSEQRQGDSERSRKTIASLQSQMDKLLAEKSNLVTEKMQEQKRSEAIKEDLTKSQNQLQALREQNENLQSEVATLRNGERKIEMLLKDSRKLAGDLIEKSKRHEKDKAEIMAELEAQKKISHTKRDALEMATAEISKANEIIMKQSKELLKMKKTISWRTEVALQQEKIVLEKEQLLKMSEDKNAQLRQLMDGLRTEIPNQLESLRIFANSLEKKYSTEIKTLKDKLAPAGKENYAKGKVLAPSNGF